MRTTIVRARTILAGALLSFLLACSSMKVQTTKDPQADLSQYKTYAWAPRPRTAPNGPQSSILDQTVKSSVERELAKKGLRPAENSKPDLLISYFGISKNSVTYGTPINPGGPYRPGGPWGPYDSGHYTQPIITREGDLTLQFHDASTKRVVWQGTATGTISEAGAGQEQVAQAVNKLIEKYPAA